MLIRYSVENFLSYKDRQVFSMVAGQTTKHRNHIYEANGKRVLKGSFFFGANASGKSNIIESIKFSKSIVEDGVKRGRLKDKHFRIDPSYINKPGVFQYDIFTNGHFYSYGFSISYSAAKILNEWLYLCDKSEVQIFERFNDGTEPSTETSLKFSSKDNKKRFQLFAEDVSDTRTLLLEISEKKIIDHPDFQAIKDVVDWFNNLTILTPRSRLINKNRLMDDVSTSLSLENMLAYFDTGICSVIQKEESLEDILKFVSPDERAEMLEQLEESFTQGDPEYGIPDSAVLKLMDEQYEIHAEDGKLLVSHLMSDHGNADDLFLLTDESDGTQRLFDLIPVLLDLQKTAVFLIDELDRSFHTKLVWNFIETFYTLAGSSPSQLIASVHDVNIMDLNLLRRDEIWFVERLKDHSSRIFSLNKFQDRYDKVVSKDYLLGRYGAIPCLSQPDELERGES